MTYMTGYFILVVCIFILYLTILIGTMVSYIYNKIKQIDELMIKPHNKEGDS